MENKNNNPLNANSKSLKEILVPIILIAIIAIGVLGYFIFNKNKSTDDPEFIDNKEKEQIERQTIPGSTEFEKDGVSFSFPSDYEVEEREKGFYFISKNDNEAVGESGISVDSRRLEGINSDYNQAISIAKNSLVELVEKEIPNGIKTYGKIKEGFGQGTPVLSVYLRYGEGALVVETSGEILNEAVFDQVVNSIKIN